MVGESIGLDCREEKWSKMAERGIGSNALTGTGFGPPSPHRSEWTRVILTLLLIISRGPAAGFSTRSKPFLRKIFFISCLF